MSLAASRPGRIKHIEVDDLKIGIRTMSWGQVAKVKDALIAIDKGVIEADEEGHCLGTAAALAFMYGCESIEGLIDPQTQEPVEMKHRGKGSRDQRLTDACMDATKHLHIRCFLPILIWNGIDEGEQGKSETSPPSAQARATTTPPPTDTRSVSPVPTAREDQSSPEPTPVEPATASTGARSSAP